MTKTGINMGTCARVKGLPSTLLLPDEAPTQTFGFIARKGAGKTYAAGVLVEGLLAMGAPVAILDPIGNWYGLRLSADGKKPGLPIAVLGGIHGDVPLAPESGSQVADLLMDERMAAVIDVSPFSNGERKRFVTAFAEQLLQRAKTVLEPLMVVLEEAQLFAPQRVMKGDERMLGAVEKIVRLGRNYGLGSTLISQRPQSVNKEVLNQVECLFVGQLNGAQERKAVGAWVADNNVSPEVIKGLPNLPVGTMEVWSPQWLQLARQVKIKKKTTYDASATPKLTKKRGLKRLHGELAKIDVGRLQSALETSIQAAQDNNPVALRSEVSDLKREGAMLTHEAERAKANWSEISEQCQALKDDNTRLREQLAATEVAPIPPELADLIDNEIIKIRKGFDVLENQFIELRGQADRLNANKPKPAPRVESRFEIATTGRMTQAQAQGGPPRRVSDSVPQATNGAPAVKAGARRMVEVCAQFFPGAMTKKQIATAAKMKSSGGTFSTYWSIITRAGYLQLMTDGRWKASPIGMNLAGIDSIHKTLHTVQDRIEFWNERLKAGARRMLSEVANRPHITRAELALAVEMTPTGGTFSTYLSTLTNNNLVLKEDGCYILHPQLTGGVHG